MSLPCSRPVWQKTLDFLLCSHLKVEACPLTFLSACIPMLHLLFSLFCKKNPRYLQLSVGRLHSVIVTIKIPNVHSCRKVKVSLDETVGELIR